MRGIFAPLLVATFTLAILLVGVFPTRMLLEQRSELAAAEADLAEVTEHNDGLRDRIAALETDAEIERIARAEYNLVYPGQEAYAILPPPREPVEVPSTWPFSVVVDEMDG